MKRVRPALSPDEVRAYRLTWWFAALFVLPIAALVIFALLQAPARQAQLHRVPTAELWVEPLGPQTFTGDYLTSLVATPPDFSKAVWQKVSLPNSIEMGASIDLPANAPKSRAWFRVQIPAELQDLRPGQGRVAVLGYRVMAGGPWSVWANGKLQHANMADWRIQWNRPLRVSLPLGTQEFWIAVPHAQVQGYAMGSLFLGPADVVDSAWMERNFWMSDAPKITAAVAALMLIVGVHLALSRRNEPVFALLALNALCWFVTNFQWTNDFTGQDSLSIWYGSAVDSVITWSIVYTCIFAFEYEKIAAPRIRMAMLVYAAASTLITLPVWEWAKNALIAQHMINMLVYLLGMVVVAAHIVRKPRREGLVLLLMMMVQLPLGVHTLLNLTNQKSPDQIYTFPFAVLLLYGAFTYVTSRRTVLALNAAENHEALLRAQLEAQQMRLVEQHTRLQQLEVAKRLDTQREAIMQDLHDRLGSNLTSALLQARKGVLTPQETVLLLQDLADELRHVGESASQEQRSLNEVLAELRQRVQNRLAHGGIELVWAVDPKLGLPLEAASAQHVLAMLSEAIANIIKHAEATRIRLEARRTQDAVVLTITDNGKGFNPSTVDPGRGLPGMRYRAKAIGADVVITGGEQGGTCWQLTLPNMDTVLDRRSV